MYYNPARTSFHPKPKKNAILLYQKDELEMISVTPK